MDSPEPERQPQCVLIVEPLADSREVLRLMLSRRGLQTVETDNAEQGLRLAERHRPGVILLDLDAPRAELAAVREQYCARSQSDGSSLLLLGTAPRPPAENEQVVAKPYHFAPLIRTIEQLARRESSVERRE